MYIDIIISIYLKFKYMYMLRLIYIFLPRELGDLGSFSMYTRLSKDTNKFYV